MPKVEVWVNNLELTRLGELLETFDQERRAAELAPPTKQVVSGFGELARRRGDSVTALLPPVQGSVDVYSTPPDVAVFVSDAGTIFDQDDVIQATLQLASVVGIPVATDLLKEFGVERARDIAGTDWEKYVTKAKALVTAHKAALDAQE